MLKGERIVIVMPACNTEETLKKTYDEMPHDIVDDVLIASRILGPGVLKGGRIKLPDSV